MNELPILTDGYRWLSISIPVGPDATPEEVAKAAADSAEHFMRGQG